MSPLPIPRITPPDAESWEDIRQTLAPGLRQTFHQPWRDRPEPAFAPAEARLGHQGTNLLVHALLTDHEPANRARTPNARTWELGDAFELFLKADAPDSDPYYEFHVTPENQRLQLRFPDRETIRRVRRGVEPLAPRLVDAPLFVSRARIAPGRDRWEVFMRIDLDRLFTAAELRAGALRLLISRYDYRPGNAEPVLSCNVAARLPAPDFHRQDHWTPVSLAPA